MEPSADFSALSFELAMKELEAIVRRLESGNAELESALKDFERGKALQQHCERKLSEARLKVETVIKNETGALELKPFAGAN